ncbi:hypothetical protein DITRI_Ditri03aG0117300 [Diplodiscus trichospermus]
MKKSKSSKLDKLDRFDMVISLTKQRSFQILIIVGLLYVLLVTIEIPFVFQTGFSTLSQEPLTRLPRLASEVDVQEKEAPSRPLNWVSKNSPSPTQFQHHLQLRTQSGIVSNLSFDAETFDPSGKDGSLELHKSAKLGNLGESSGRKSNQGKFKLTRQRSPRMCPNCVLLRFLYPGRNLWPVAWSWCCPVGLLWVLT